MDGNPTYRELVQNPCYNSAFRGDSIGGSLREVFFKPRVGPTEHAYFDFSSGLIMFREASLPDICVACGTPAHGNIYRAQFEPYHKVFALYEIVYWAVGTRYIVDFPFCSICTSENFDIHTSRIDGNVGFFQGVSHTFLRLLPSIPQELAAELEGTWTQRAMRWLVR
jgi:hypothetical protein